MNEFGHALEDRFRKFRIGVNQSLAFVRAWAESVDDATFGSDSPYTHEEYVQALGKVKSEWFSGEGRMPEELATAFTLIGMAGVWLGEKTSELMGNRTARLAFSALAIGGILLSVNDALFQHHAVAESLHLDGHALSADQIYYGGSEGNLSLQIPHIEIGPYYGFLDAPQVVHETNDILMNNATTEVIGSIQGTNLGEWEIHVLGITGSGRIQHANNLPGSEFDGQAETRLMGLGMNRTTGEARFVFQYNSGDGTLNAVRPRDVAGFVASGEYAAIPAFKTTYPDGSSLFVWHSQNGDIPVAKLSPDGHTMTLEYPGEEPIPCNVSDGLRASMMQMVKYESATSVATATPVVGGEATPIFDPATMDKVEIITSTDKVEGAVAPGGAIVQGSLNLGESVTNTHLVSKIDVTDEFGANTFLKIAYILSHQGQGQPTDEQLRAYGEQLLKVQNGADSCSTVEARTFAFDANVPGDKQLPMTLQMFCGAGQVSEGARKIDSIEVVYINDWDVNEEQGKYVAPQDRPRLAVPRSGGGGAAFEVEVDGAVLRIKVGVSARFDANPEWSIARNTALLFEWLNRNDSQEPFVNFNPTNANDREGKRLIERGFSVE